MFIFTCGPMEIKLLGSFNLSHNLVYVSLASMYLGAEPWALLWYS